MMNMKEKIKKVSSGKGFVYILISFVIFFIVAGVGTIAKFESRIPLAKQYAKRIECQHENSYFEDGKYGKNYVEGNKSENNQIEGRDEKNIKEEFFSYMKFTKSDYIFMGVVVGIGWILLGIYWLYTIGYVMSKAFSVGANGYLFGAITLFTNIIGLIGLMIYIKIHLICPECGKLQKRSVNYCSLCGTAIYKVCPDCGRRISVKDNYCNGCGRENK